MMQIAILLAALIDRIPAWSDRVMPEARMHGDGMMDGMMGGWMSVFMIVPLFVSMLLLLAGIALAVWVISRSGRGVGEFHRSHHDRVIAGVAGGMSEYFNVDPTVIRVVWLLALIFPMMTLIALLLYIVLAVALPSESVEA